MSNRLAIGGLLCVAAIAGLYSIGTVVEHKQMAKAEVINAVHQKMTDIQELGVGEFGEQYPNLLAASNTICSAVLDGGCTVGIYSLELKTSIDRTIEAWMQILRPIAAGHLSEEECRSFATDATLNFAVGQIHPGFELKDTYVQRGVREDLIERYGFAGALPMAA